MSTIIELLGSGVFGFVQNDIRSNVAVCLLRYTTGCFLPLLMTVQGVRERYKAATEDSVTLEQLVRVENEGGSRVATACLIRLVRCVSFSS